jgi:hypothetical protein
MLPSHSKSDGEVVSTGGNSRSRQEEVIAKHLQGKQGEWAAVADKKEPLQLLDLPVDVLRVIVKEVTHTNDLTSLALSHSALHHLAIPLIYSRFDIVWPDTPTTAENRLGVDALTYGLATLVMAPDVFGEIPFYPRSNEQMQKCGHCGRFNQCSHNPQPPRGSGSRRSIRRGNAFARYTQKFSLSNGPAEWVSEYQINKESGKMLGTLVALAVGRMRNLETFVWDMPTGILRDIFIALASLAKRDDGEDCRLERIWVRWHDNSDGTPHSHTIPTAPSNPTLNIHGQATSIASLLNSSQSLFQIPPYPRVEFPTFSILPPLKSLTVLDVDELPYAEEMCVLIERSAVRLREFRLGLAKHAQYDFWTRPSESANTEPLASTTPDRTHQPGGILELLFSGICDLSRTTTSSDVAADMHGLHLVAGNEQSNAQNLVGRLPVETTQSEDRDVDELSGFLADQSLQSQDDASIAERSTVNLGIEINEMDVADEDEPAHAGDFDTPVPKPRASRTLGEGSGAASCSSLSLVDPFVDMSSEKHATKLRLEILELERVPLAIPIMSKAIDWTKLHTLTILGCRNHEQLWKALRKRFTPESRNRSSSISLRSSSRLTTPISNGILDDDYSLKIRHMHTDMVSPSLIAFLRDALAENSLESLFLQECPSYKSPVSIDMIYKNVVRRHRASLKKLSIDSWLRVNNDGTNNNWRRWVFSRELLSFITSGKMMRLRELGLALDYKDWHMFLQRLPNVTQLRSLYICRIAGHVHQRYDPREAALQVCDIVSLRPELELCYLGIEAKCYEVLEYPVGRKTSVSDFGSMPATGVNVQSDAESDEDDGTSDSHAGVNITDNSDGADDSDMEMTSSRGGETEDEMGDHSGKTAKQFRLREILFYDDKVAIFKARHGKL